MKLILQISKIAFKIIGGLTEWIIGLLLILLIYIQFSSQISPPEHISQSLPVRKEVGKDEYRIGKNWLKKNDFGIWEMYLEGTPYERGLVYGALSKELCQRQEEIFVNQINQFVPSGFAQKFLRLMLGFFNKELVNNIPLENQQEIYGISQSFSSDFDYVAPKFTRILNYHAAHDIGHALNDYSIVGCTSFALKGKKTKDGTLKIGRNFDFYVGDEFAEDKLILFLRPDKGYAFTSYAWAGFTGVASGLNEKGLSVTINAAKSDLPTSTKTPIALLAREILQYASTIEEAFEIAQKRTTFVSESLLIGSKKDEQSAIIEKSPTQTHLFYAPNEEVTVCSNHYQSEGFSTDKNNLDNIRQSDSKYRFERVNELLNKKDSLNLTEMAQILRNQKGIENDTLGMGNPKAINQLICHHSVLIEPEDLRFSISTSDYQLGAYISYDLAQVFRKKKTNPTVVVQKDDFLNSPDYLKFNYFKKIKQQIFQFVQFDQTFSMTDAEIQTFINSNAESYITYEMLAKYFEKIGQKEKAITMISKALEKEMASLSVEQVFLEWKNRLKEQ